MSQGSFPILTTKHTSEGDLLDLLFSDSACPSTKAFFCVCVLRKASCTLSSRIPMGQGPSSLLSHRWVSAPGNESAFCSWESFPQLLQSATCSLPPGPLRTVHITAACPTRAPVTRSHHLHQGVSPCATVRVESVKPHRGSACTPGWTCTLHPNRKRI